MRLHARSATSRCSDCTESRGKCFSFYRQSSQTSASQASGDEVPRSSQTRMKHGKGEGLPQLQRLQRSLGHMNAHYQVITIGEGVDNLALRRHLFSRKPSVKLLGSAPRKKRRDEACIVFKVGWKMALAQSRYLGRPRGKLEADCSDLVRALQNRDITSKKRGHGHLDLQGSRRLIIQSQVIIQHFGLSADLSVDRHL